MADSAKSRVFLAWRRRLHVTLSLVPAPRLGPVLYWIGTHLEKYAGAIERGDRARARDTMNRLDQLIPEARLVEVDHVDVGVPPDRAWQVVRHADLGRSRFIRALFAIRTLPSRLVGREVDTAKLRIDDIAKSDRSGFQILFESDAEVAVGAIGKVWELDIPFVDVEDGDAFARFAETGYAKVAWSLRVLSRGAHGARIVLEVRVSVTDEESWPRFRRYFRIIGPASRFIRRQVLASLARELGIPEAEENERSLPGDELLGDAIGQMTDGITIAATPEAIWPWLVQMGCRRAGWYSWDLLDNAGIESAKEIRPELEKIAVGDVLPATPEGDDGFEVLSIDPPRALVLGGLFDPDSSRQLPFAAERPARYWHVSWAFLLEPLAANETRLIVRARAAFAASQKLHAAWIRPVHHFMERAQLQNLKARVEETKPRDGWRDVARGALGAAGIALDFLTPFLRPARSHWGLDEATAGRDYPGDDLVSEPRWSWTHGVEIDAPPDRVWPWVAQIGADRGGFYSFQWLENLAGCEVNNAETIHAGWAVRKGDGLKLHPGIPPLPVVAVEPERYFLAYASPRDKKGPWVEVSWLFFVEELPKGRSRFVSRFRSSSSDDLATRFAYGPYVTESVGFVMDRQMLLGVKERAESRSAPRSSPMTTG